MTEAQLIEQTKEFVKNNLQGAEGGHDWFHTLRPILLLLPLLPYYTILPILNFMMEMKSWARPLQGNSFYL